MWMNTEALELDSPAISEARRCLAPMCGRADVEVSSIELEDEVVVSIELGSGLTATDVCIETRGGVLRVHVPRKKA